MNRACFPKEKHQNSQKWAKFMNFSFCPFLRFGLPGRLLKIFGVSKNSLKILIVYFWGDSVYFRGNKVFVGGASRRFKGFGNFSFVLLGGFWGSVGQGAP